MRKYIYNYVNSFYFRNKDFEIFLLYSLRFFQQFNILARINCGRVKKCIDYVSSRQLDCNMQEKQLHFINRFKTLCGIANRIFCMCHAVCVIDMGKWIFRGKLARQAARNKRDDTAKLRHSMLQAELQTLYCAYKYFKAYRAFRS